MSFIIFENTTPKGTLGDVASANDIYYSTGIGYYEVVKSETVSASKKVIAYDTNTGTFHEGDDARRVLKIGSKTKVKPSDVPSGYRMFVNSTSSNRGLNMGQGVIFDCPEGKMTTSNAKTGVKRAAPPAEGSPPAKKKKAAPAKNGEAAKKAEVEVATSGAYFPRVNGKGKGKAAGASGPYGDYTQLDNSHISALPAPSDKKWQMVGSMIVGRGGTAKPSATVVAFDLDSTIITTKSGKVFAKGPADWVIMFKEIAPKLKEEAAAGKKLVIFTNQLGISKGKITAAAWQGKVEAIEKELGVEFQVFAATKEDPFRKPATDMWAYFQEKCNGGIEVDRDASLYVGDAAGRPAGWKPGVKKDFSCSDRKFAFNVGVPFLTPEEYFLGDAPVDFTWDGCVPFEIPRDAPIVVGDGELVKSEQELVLMCGFPASGKSGISKRILAASGYERVNRDELKTPAKCLKKCVEALAAGKSVVIDNTNPDPAARKPYIDAAKKAGVPVRCFRMTTERAVADHLNYFRERETGGEVRHIPGVAYGSFIKKFQEPQLSEGISEILQVNFVPDFLGDTQKEAMFNQFI